MNHYPDLAKAAYSCPIIDHHAHPILAEKNRNAFPLQAIVSEANGDALTRNAPYTLASYRAITQLFKLFGVKTGQHTWDTFKNKRDETDYADLCNTCFKPTGIQCILLDDGLGGVADLAEPISWHNRLTASPCKRIVRIEAEAEDILRNLVDSDPDEVSISVVNIVDVFEQLLDWFRAAILAHAKDDHVVGFKSVICYRTGLDIASSPPTHEKLRDAMLALLQQYRTTGSLRLQQKILNDYLVGIVLHIAGQYYKPVQFHTGLGDKDIQVPKSSPAHMQPVIEAHPGTAIVLLHSSYPYVRDAGYLASVYGNVYVDFGEVFPLLSGDGQRTVVRQILELAPVNKILWSSDGHWWPESYYLAVVQARLALYEVLSDYVYREELTEQQAIEIVENSFFQNANRIYNLGLEPLM